jgi:hypothetical protein
VQKREVQCRGQFHNYTDAAFAIISDHDSGKLPTWRSE